MVALYIPAHHKIFSMLHQEALVSTSNLYEDLGFNANKAVAKLVRKKLLIALQKELRKQGQLMQKKRSITSTSTNTSISATTGYP